MGGNTELTWEVQEMFTREDKLIKIWRLKRNQQEGTLAENREISKEVPKTVQGRDHESLKYSRRHWGQSADSANLAYGGDKTQYILIKIWIGLVEDMWVRKEFKH